MITFDPPIVVQPPPITDPSTNQVIQPEPVMLSSLDLIFTDNPSKKTLTAHVERYPFHFIIYSGQDYDNIGDWTKAEAENIVSQQIGSDPQAYLQSRFPRTLEQDPNGPGTILSNMIKTLGINFTPNCSCRQRAIQMNIEGPTWCENNIETIIGWLHEEAKKRSLPFVDMVVRAMVNRAISKSRRLLANSISNET